MHSLEIRTPEREAFVDVTERIARVVEQAGFRDGLCHVFVPHTTAGVTINEGADPSVRRDMLAWLARAVPRSGDYRHAEGNSDAHIKASLMGSSELIAVRGGRLVLGTWQAVYFCEFDGPRTRRLELRFLEGREPA